MFAAAGLRAGDRIALLTAHGAPTVAAMLGALATDARTCRWIRASRPPGCAMVDAAGVTAVACAAEHRDLASTLAGERPVVPLDEVPPAPLHPVAADPDALAYVLFTSGSTGVPKAVGQTHRNLAHVVDNQIAALGVGPDDRLSLLASFSFDAAIPDLYPALLTGAAVVPVDLRRQGLAYAVEQLDRHRATVLHCTPTVYRFLLDTLDARRLPTVRAVLLGGEQATWPTRPAAGTGSPPGACW
ncbi:AMP-binding protein [Micromonospora sp. BRA006-A]|nr:AMP-binding protein [Micromonospora sp. BRA006-A]